MRDSQSHHSHSLVAGLVVEVAAASSLVHLSQEALLEEEAAWRAARLQGVGEACDSLLVTVSRHRNTSLTCLARSRPGVASFLSTERERNSLRVSGTSIRSSREATGICAPGRPGCAETADLQLTGRPGRAGRAETGRGQQTVPVDTARTRRPRTRPPPPAPPGPAPGKPKLMSSTHNTEPSVEHN